VSNENSINLSIDKSEYFSKSKTLKEIEIVYRNKKKELIRRISFAIKGIVLSDSK
tara:strand:- start:243 stop:407 length:165 start_codon:yes stop_codon:yes gene_type:complete